ncbi:MAG: hypothetical protein KKD69_02445 [Euryarchaeota archaeon]|nr:hypothetical protein [Euryarchaeota archaeon]MBU4491301.1 hypothetical protein [Euryarchaeota archaeon]MCG2727243.1 hypothetical protein [Candidatus Methanoperedenaceae archaeon]
MRKLNLDNGKFHLEDEIEAVVEGEVKKIGNGAQIFSIFSGRPYVADYFLKDFSAEMLQIKDLRFNIFFTTLETKPLIHFRRPHISPVQQQPQRLFLMRHRAPFWHVHPIMATISGLMVYAPVGTPSLTSGT